MNEEKKKRFNIKLKKWDIISIVALVIFLIVITPPVYIPKEGCEVARPEYKCASFEEVMIENCAYWGEYDCDTQADVSLPQIEWYIDNLCDLQNKYHGTGLDCSNLQIACNQITDTQTCPIGFG